ncbi:MAG: AMIN-like domain-containing (lipo)protein [Phycicoccus sp.]
MTIRPITGRRLHRAAAGLGAAAVLLAVPAATGATPAGSPAPAFAAPYCGIAWGSLAKASPATGTGDLTSIRSGRHTCFDRLVVEVAGRTPGYDVRYVDMVYADGSGEPVPVAGGARLAVMIRAGWFSAPPTPSVAGYSTFRQVRWAGAFEGENLVALGVRARLPFRVWTTYDSAADRSKVVVDVAHAW